MKYHLLYKTTNTVTKKYYIGIHTTSFLNDGYIGSGKILKRSIAKYGVQNHSVEVLQRFNSREQLVRREIEILTEDTLSDPLCMNIRGGGEGGGGFTKEQQIKNNRRSQEVQRELCKNYEWFASRSSKISASLKEQYMRGERAKNIDLTFKGNTHTDSAKAKISEANSIKQKGKNNSQYGTMWIYNASLKISKKILKDDPIPKGWKPGRKIRW